MCLLVAGLAACREGGPGGAPSASGSLPSAAAPVPPRPPVPSPAEIADELSTKPMELLRFRFTSGIEAREPKDELKAAKPGQRVYGYLALRNRTGRKKAVTLSWSVNGEVRTKIELPIDESWQFRTWGYNTLQDTDRSGTLRLEVTDESGHPLVDEELPIRP
jgi:hypothetical protein